MRHTRAGGFALVRCWILTPSDALDFERGWKAEGALVLGASPPARFLVQKPERATTPSQTVSAERVRTSSRGPGPMGSVQGGAECHVGDALRTPTAGPIRTRGGSGDVAAVAVLPPPSRSSRRRHRRRKRRLFHMRTCVRVTSQGTPYGRFRRALDRWQPTAALSAAAELPQVALTDALELLSSFVTPTDRGSSEPLCAGTAATAANSRTSGSGKRRPSSPCSPASQTKGRNRPPTPSPNSSPAVGSSRPPAS